MSRPLRLLVVEDNPSDREFVSEAVAEYGEGIELVLATSIAEAELAVRKEPPPDLALVDLHLGHENGLDLVPRLKVPVAVLSTTSDPVQRDISLAAGARAFLTKPLRFEDYRELLALVRMLVRTHDVRP